MAKLIVTQKDGKKFEHELTDDVTTIGRAKSNILQILDKESSRQHCRIEKTDSGYRLVDISRNGTLVNGISVKNQTLKVGDKIEIGAHTIEFDEEVTVTAEEIGPTVETETVKDEVSKVEAARVVRSDKPLFAVEIVEGPAKGKIVELVGKPIGIGRSESNALCLADDSASSFHAEISKGPDGFVLKDLASTNGTKIAGKKIEKEKLTPGTRIEIGRTVLLFRDMSKPVPGPDDIFGTTVLDPEKLARELAEDEAKARIRFMIRLIAAPLILAVIAVLCILASRAFRKPSEIATTRPGTVLANGSFSGDTNLDGSPKGWRWTARRDLLWEVDRGSDRYPEKQPAAALSLTRNPHAPLDAEAKCVSIRDIPVSPGQGYELSGFVRTERATGAYGVALVFIGQRQTERRLLSLFGSHGEWKEISSVFVPPAWAAAARVECFAYGNMGTVQFDDVSLVETAMPEGMVFPVRVSFAGVECVARENGIFSVEKGGMAVIGGARLVLRGKADTSAVSEQGLARPFGPPAPSGAGVVLYEELINFATLTTLLIEEKFSPGKNGVTLGYVFTADQPFTVDALELRLIPLAGTGSEFRAYLEDDSVVALGEEPLSGVSELLIPVPGTSGEGSKGVVVLSGAGKVSLEAAGVEPEIVVILGEGIQLGRAPMPVELRFKGFSECERKVLGKAREAVETAASSGQAEEEIRAISHLLSLPGVSVDEGSKMRERLAKIRREGEQAVEAAGRELDELRAAKSKAARERALLRIRRTLDSSRRRWRDTDLVQRFDEISSDIDEIVKKWEAEEREAKAVEIRNRANQFFDAKAYAVAIAYYEKVLNEFPQTAAAAEVKASAVIQQCTQLAMEEAEINRIVSSIRKRVNNFVLSGSYAKALRALRSDPNYHRVADHPAIIKLVEELTRKSKENEQE